jgi:hypothetical protein
MHFPFGERALDRDAAGRALSLGAEGISINGWNSFGSDSSGHLESCSR